MNNPAHHTIANIQLVAAGLMRLTDVRSAATQLQRIYGRERAETALLSLARAQELQARGIDLTDREVASPVGGAVERHIEIDLTDAMPSRREFSSRGPGLRGKTSSDWL